MTGKGVLHNLGKPCDLVVHTSTATANHTDYTARRVNDLDAIETHLRIGTLSIKRIALMYGFPAEYIQRVSDDLERRDPVYRFTKAHS